MTIMTLSCILAFSWSVTLNAATGEEVFVPAAQVSQESFEVHLKLNQQRLGFADAWVQKRSNESASQLLEDLLIRAQEEFLSGSPGEAQVRFQQVLALLPHADWGPKQLVTFHLAALRTAQLAADPAQRTLALHRAAHLATPEPIDPALFPPPLLKEYEAIQKNQRPEELNLSRLFPGFRYLLIDGRVFPISRRVRVFKDDRLHRFTLVSDRLAPQSAELAWTAIDAWRPQAIYLVLGTCASPQLHPEAARLSAQIYWGESCLPASASASPTPRILSSTYAQTPSATPPKLKETPRLTWLWWTLGAVAAVWAVDQMQNQSKPATVVPTAAQDF